MSRDALVVGISTYSYKRLNNLNAPGQDAEAVAQLLEKYGDFKVRRLPAVKDKQNSTTKVGKKTKVNLSQLEEAIVQLFKPEGKVPDTALLYFSGHGLRKHQGILEGFLATSDVNQDLGNWGIRLKWLRELLQESEVKQQIIILDCCYSGELLNFTEADPGDRGKGRDRCFIAASRPFEVAYEEIDNRHSVFTAALLEGLEPLQDKWVTNYTLVEKLGAEYHSFPQRPIFGNSGETINLTRRWTRASQNSATLSSAVCPYKGLRYFDCIEEDAKFFYGRTALTDELLEKVRSGNFIAVLGASGSGKSSVVRAGLLYQLKLGLRLSGSENWLIKIFKPGENPSQSLALSFLNTELSDIERAKQLAQAEELIAKGANGLRQLVTSSVINDKQRLVLVIDQFEEVFTLCKDNEQREKFFECLLGALERCGKKLCLMLTMRADFFGKCAEQEYSGLAQQIQQHLVTVTPMTREELKQAIVKPAKQVELEIEPELVEEMLIDVVNAPGSLPLLQDTLTELWKNHSDNCLRLNTYTHLGGVMGTLRQRATEVYDSFNQEEQAVCKHIFLALTQLGEGTEDTRRRCFKQDLINKRYSEELIDKVIQRLADEKLIVTSEIIAKGGTSQRVPIVDVAHEALIRHWSTLRQWIEENRNKLRLNRQIEQAAQLWRHSGEKDDFLLQGVRLAEAEDIYIKYNDELSDDVQKFIEACLAERKRKEIQEKRRLRQAQRAVVALSVLGIAACSFGGLAYWQGRSAKLREIEALNSSSAKDSLNRQLEALIASVKAGKQLQQVFAVPKDIKVLTKNRLQKVLANIQERNRLEGHGAVITRVKFSPNGKIIASASADNTIKLWRKDGSLIRTIAGHKKIVSNIYFTSNGNKIVSASSDGTIKIWRVIDGKLLNSFENSTSGIINISPDHTIIVSVNLNNRIELLRANDGHLIKTIDGHTSLITSVSFSPDGKTIASGSRDKTIKLWNTINGKLLTTIDDKKYGHKDFINHVNFSPNGKTIASASKDKTVKLWNIRDVNNVKLIKEFNQHKDSVWYVTFSPNGKFIASASRDKSIKVWNSKGIELETFEGHTDVVSSVSFNADNQTIASGSVDGTIRIWQSQRYKTTSLPKILLGHNKGVYDVSFSPDGTMIASGSEDGTIKLWQYLNSRLIKTIPGNGSPVYGISFSPDGNTIASAHKNKTVNIWKTSDGKLLLKLRGHDDEVNKVKFSHDGKTIATASRDATVKIWNSTNGNLIHTLKGHKGEVFAVSFSPDNQTIVSGSRDKTVKIWNYQDGALLKNISANGGIVSGVSFSPNGKVIASSHVDKTVKLWDFKNGKLLQTLTGHTSYIYSSVFSPDGQMIASASDDKTVKIWKSDGNFLKTLPEHGDVVLNVSFSPDSKSLVSGSFDNAVRLWKVDAKQVKTLEADSLITNACDWLHDYLNTNSNIKQDKKLCVD